MAARIDCAAVGLDLDQPSGAVAVDDHLVEELPSDQLRIAPVEGAVEYAVRHPESAVRNVSGVGIGSFVPIFTPT